MPRPPGKKKKLPFRQIAWGMLLAGLFLAGCVQRVVVPLEPPERIVPEKESEAAFFSNAESLFSSGALPEALAAYESYLNRFPRGPNADGAVMKIGAIQKTQGDPEAARTAYERLVEAFPKSRFYPEAQVEILESDYQEARYDRVIPGALALLQEALSDSLRRRVLSLLGEAYLASGEFAEAVGYFLMEFYASGEPDREKILSRMEEAIGQMDNDTLRILMQRTDDPVLKNRLVLAYARNAADSEKPEKAVEILEEFLDRHPEQDPEGKTRTRLEELASQIAFDRHAVGCLLPLSGPYQTYGNKALRGVEIALSDFVSSSGNAQVKLIVKDTHSDPTVAVAALRELAQAGVAAVIGPITEAESVAVEAQQVKIPLITLTQKEGITHAGDYVFRNFMTPRMQADALAGYCVKKLGLTRFAVLYPDESYGKTFLNLFWDALITHGGTLVGVESYPTDQTDFADSIKKLVGLYYTVPEEIERRAEAVREHRPLTGSHTGGISGEWRTAQAAAGTGYRKRGEPYIDFEALFIPDAPDKVGLILPQLAFHDIREVYLLGTNLWHSGKLLQMAQKYAQGAMMTDGFNATSPAGPVKAFVEKFTAAYGEPPGFMEAVAYDSARIVLEAAARPNVRFRSHLKEEILNLTGFEGLTGPTAFGPDGEAIKAPFLFRVKGDRFVEVR